MRMRSKTGFELEINTVELKFLKIRKASDLIGFLKSAEAVIKTKQNKSTNVGFKHEGEK